MQQRSSRRTTWLSHALIAGQIAAALVVLVGASLLIKSLVRMQQVELGFVPDHVLTLRLSLPSARYGVATSIDDGRYLPAQRELLDRLRLMPGIEAVTFGTSIFVPNYDNRSSVQLDDGRQFLNRDLKARPMTPGLHFVGPDYFRVHGAVLAAGREFGPGDDFAARRVVVVNETMARLLWPGQSAIGRRVNFGRPTGGTMNEPWAEVVGVVRDIRHGGVEQALRPHVYRSAMQYARREFDVMIRTTIPPARFLAGAREVVRRFDRDIPIVSAALLTDTVNAATAPTRYSSAVLSLFAAITTLLCAVGVYSVLAYAVALRRRELGIRMALGAAPGRLVRDVLWTGSRSMIAGIVGGLAGASLATRVLGSLLYEVSARDPYVFAGTAATVAMLGTWRRVRSRQARREDRPGSGAAGGLAVLRAGCAGVERPPLVFFTTEEQSQRRAFLSS